MQSVSSTNIIHKIINRKEARLAGVKAPILCLLTEGKGMKILIDSLQDFC